jgi:NAD+ synthase
MDYKKLSTEISEWIKREVERAKCKGVVFGLSGGVDSSVVGILCKKAFPHDHLALLLPCFTSKEDLEDANLIVEKFGLNSKMINLEPVFLEFSRILGIAPDSRELSVANIKPRLRMITLYYFANKMNYLVVGTGNKSELTMGYFTKYGDGGVDILPIGDLTKSEVYKLARALGVPERIIKKPPSAGLWPGQTDEGEMGVKYKELDRLIIALERGRSLSGFKKDIVEKVLKRSKQVSHKLKPPKIFKVKLA